MNNRDMQRIEDIQKEITDAESRIRKHIRETPLEFSPRLSRQGRCRVYLKLECTQISGSFKYRGALNKYLSLPEHKRREPVITASSGNHGAALAQIIHSFGGKGKIFIPENASPAKVEDLRLYGIDLILHGHDCIMSETLAQNIARQEGLEFISPYNDPKIIGGQGTIGIELVRQLEKMDDVLVPVGGGGLVSGIAAHLKGLPPRIQIIGCQPRASAVMYESIEAGQIIDMNSEPTLADGTAGGVDPDTITFPLCRDLIDRFTLVSEDQIKKAILFTLEHHQLLIEGAAALPLAAFLKEIDRYEDRNVVLVVSGKRIGLEKLTRILTDSRTS